DERTYRRRTGTALLSFALVAALFTYGFRLVRVQGRSMDPTFYDGQWLLVRRMNWPAPPLRVGDVVVFRMDDGMLVKGSGALRWWGASCGGTIRARGEGG